MPDRGLELTLDELVEALEDFDPMPRMFDDPKSMAGFEGPRMIPSGLLGEKSGYDLAGRGKCHALVFDSGLMIVSREAFEALK